MINGNQSAVRPADLSAGILEAFEGLRRSHFVNQVSVDIQQNGSIFLLVDDVGVKHLVVESLGLLVGGGHDETIHS